MPAGERGEIVLRGPKVFKGYWRDPEATARAFAGGWFHTGDVGVRDEDGYLFIVDRLKDMIVSGGENIAGSEVERVLYEHAAVLEAAVVGRPDERWGEVPVAFVVLRDGHAATADELVGALPRPAGQVQGAQGRDLPRGAAAQPVGQGAQARAASRGRRAGAGAGVGMRARLRPATRRAPRRIRAMAAMGSEGEQLTKRALQVNTAAPDLMAALELENRNQVLTFGTDESAARRGTWAKEKG